MSGRCLWLSWLLFAISGCDRKGAVDQQVLRDLDGPIKAITCPYSSALKKRTRCFSYSPTGSPFILPIVQLMPLDHAVQPEVLPTLMIPGGPGAGEVTAQDHVALWLDWLDYSELGGPVIVFDHRGFGTTSLEWSCKNYTALSRELLKKPLTMGQESTLALDALNACLGQWPSTYSVASGLTPHQGKALVNQYNTRQYAKDIYEFMTQIGFEQWHIFAESYGTRVAMALAYEQPESVARLVLDSPYPHGRGSLIDAVSTFTKAFDQLFARYAAKDLESQFWRLYDELERTPLKVTTEHWVSNQTETWVLTGERLPWVIYMAMYSAQWYELIPEAIAQWLSRELGPESELLLEAFWNRAFDDAFNPLIFYATECQDNPLVTAEAFNQILKAAGRWQAFFKQDWQLDICRNRLFDTTRPLVPIHWQQPTLVVQGALDPITNQDYVAETLRQGGKTWVFKNPETSHSEFILSRCSEKVVPWFLSASEGGLPKSWLADSGDCAHYVLQ